MQDEFLRLQSTNWSRTEAGPKQGPYQHLATLETQDLSPLYASWNRDVGPSVGHTGGYLKQPTASSYMFPHFASQSPDLPLPSHLLNDEPQGHFLQLPGSPYSIPQHPMSYLLDEFPLYALNHVPDGNWASHMLLPQAQERNRLMIGSSLMEDHGAPLVPTNADVPRGASSQFASVLQSYDLAGSAPASRTALPQAQREDLDRIESSLFEYGDAIQTSTAALPGWASTDIAPVPDSSDSTRFMPWMVYFREWQDKQNAGGSGARQTGGSSTGDFRIAERDGQSNDSVQEASILGSTRMCELGPGAVPLQQQPEKNRNQKSISRSILTNLNSHQSQIDLASPTASNLGYISSVDLLRCRFNPDAPFSPKVELSDYMHILRSATTFQRRNAQRINMLKRSVSMWLPVYTTTFKPEWQSSQMEAKLAILFEHLWLINSWLLYSFDFENIKEDIHYVGQDDMMSWVVENLIGRLPVFTFLKPNSQNFVGIQKHIEKYLGAPRVTKMLSTF